MTPEQEQAINDARNQLVAAEAALTTAILAACPNHFPVQHRDGKPPWCGRCGRTAKGLLVREPLT